MILESLIAQFQQRFDYEKRAQVCLWFDEKREFIRLLPALRDRVAQSPAPFHLFEYDPGAHHGQIWIKHQIYKHLVAVPPETRKAQRFLIYVPLSEDRLDSPDDDGQHHLELLAEYRISGLTWRIGGKRPSLFSFLRQAGVRLPESPSQQRRLWEGGEDSLLAKYAAKFVDRPEAFRDVALTPQHVQAKLIGDPDQMALDLAVSPQATWQDLQQRGLASEFLDLMRDRYGFAVPMSDPASWMREFVTVLALTEAYLGYGQPAEFPFADRLPPRPLRETHVEFLRRWLRDAQSRAAWDRWIAEVEETIDLSAWAGSREGLSFAFPHLVRLRWQKTVEAFERAAGRVSETQDFYKNQGLTVRKEAEFARASHAALGAWALLEALGQFVERCSQARQRAENEETVAGLARLYVELAHEVDGSHVAIRRQALEKDLPTIGHVADRAYAEYANTLNQRFCDLTTAQGTIEIEGVPLVTGRLEETLWHAKGKRAVIIVDALRFDCALEIKATLTEQRVTIEPLRAMLPTITPIGMTALMPLSGADIRLDVQGNAVRPQVNGSDMAQRQNRIEYFRQFGADCRDIDVVEQSVTAPDGLGDLLVVFGHDAVDLIGHGDAAALIRHLDIEIHRLGRCARKLHHWGYPTVHIVTDHGFILLDEERLPPEVPCNKEWCCVQKERFALVPAAADLPVRTFPLEWDAGVRIAVPPGMAFFKAEKSFSHGGAALQEVVIPHLVSRAQTHERRRIGVEVVLPTYTLMQSVAKLVLRATSQGVPGATQMNLFGDGGRTLSVDVLRKNESGKLVSVLAEGRPREVRVNATDRKEVPVTLFFHTALRFREGELLDLNIRDTETDEQIPTGGIKLMVGRNM